MTTSSADRHAKFDRMRADMPVFFEEKSRTFLLTRMDDARAWLADASQWKDADQAEDGALVRTFKPADMNRPDDRNAGMGWMDEPDHSRVRRPMHSALVRRIARLDDAVHAIVTAQLERLPAGRFDAVADFALPIPIAVIGHILGVDTVDFARFRDWSETVIGIFSPKQDPEEDRRRRAAVEAICEYLDSAMQERRARPRDDLISDLLAEPGLQESEIRIGCLDLMLGGNVTTADLIASAVRLLLTHPDQLAELRSQPTLIAGAIEEALRMEPPTVGTQRIASSDLELRGCPIRARQVVAVVAEAANRDPEVFPDPHRFDIGRRDGPHITFGGGAHICLGAPLARLEARIAVLALVQRFSALALANPDAEPQWRPTPFFRGLARLDLSA